jgi:hypothetical protein
MTTPNEISDKLREAIFKEAATDGQFAIAAALLELTGAIERNLRLVGIGETGARLDGAPPMLPGCLEKIAMELEKMGGFSSDIIAAIDHLNDRT